MASSLDIRSSRYSKGGTVKTSTQVGLGFWERLEIPKHPSDLIYFVERDTEFRIDKISSYFYGDSRYWWVIAQINNILDPYLEITSGRMLVIPSKSRLFSEIIT
jgi:hypothetical protein